MTIIERTPQRLVLKSGSTTLTADKDAGKVVLQRKLLFWERKPIERPLSEVAEVRVDAGKDAASGAEICSTMVVMRAGGGWAVAAADKKDATMAAATLRDFLGLQPTQH